MEALQTTPHGIRCRGGASPAAGGRIWECWILASWADDLAGVSQSGAPAKFGGGLFGGGISVGGAGEVWWWAFWGGGGAHVT